MGAMLSLIARRTGYTLFLALVCSFGIFLLFDIHKEQAAFAKLGPMATPGQLHLWLQQNGYMRPVMTRFAEWLGASVRGDLGNSTFFQAPVNEVIWGRLGNSMILLVFFISIMAPLGIGLGLLAGMNEGSRLDRAISMACVITASVPSFVTAVMLTTIFVFWLHWLPGVSSMFDGFDLREMIAPVTVLVLGDVGYIARLTRGSVVTAMDSLYVRAAILKGIPFRRVVSRHALRNALVAPFTAIMLQINWAIGGLVIVEAAFAFKGLGSLLVMASSIQDLKLELACVLLLVLVTGIMQVLADIGYMLLVPTARAR